jgi:hypothetical protein
MHYGMMMIAAGVEDVVAVTAPFNRVRGGTVNAESSPSLWVSLCMNGG